MHREEKGRWPRLTELPLLVRKAFSSWRAVYLNRRPQPIRFRLRTFQVPRPIDTYNAWLEVNEWNARRESVLRERLFGLTERPLLSVVMPVHNPPLEFLNQAIQSVINQAHENWELCIADDGNTDPLVKSSGGHKKQPRIDKKTK